MLGKLFYPFTTDAVWGMFLSQCEISNHFFLFVDIKGTGSWLVKLVPEWYQQPAHLCHLEGEQSYEMNTKQQWSMEGTNYLLFQDIHCEIAALGYDQSMGTTRGSTKLQ